MKVTDQMLQEHLDNCDYWLDPCDCQYDMKEYAESTAKEKAILDKPEWCDECQWWIDEKALILEVQERRGADPHFMWVPDPDAEAVEGKGRPGKVFIIDNIEEEDALPAHAYFEPLPGDWD